MAHGVENVVGGVTATGACKLIRRLSFLLILSALAIVEVVSISPAVQYITLTFFAARHGGGDCELEPSSPPCREAASDVAVYNGISSGICNFAAALFALGLGSYSDRLGRRPIIQMRSWISAMPAASLAFYVFGGGTLWVYLVVSPAFRAFDISGVLLAYISDVITEPEDRAAAVGVFFMWCIAVVVAVLPLAGLLPARVTVAVSLCTTVVKIVYVTIACPETVRVKATNSPQGLLSTPRVALRVFCRNSFILRMAFVLVLSSLASAGVNTVLMPYLTAFFGLTRAQGTGLLTASIAGGAIGLGGGVAPLVRAVGEVGALQGCLVFTVAFPLLLIACSTIPEVGLVCGLISAPLFMLGPVISGIKSNLVAADEQGLVQGALTCVTNLATALSDFVFGLFYQHATSNGTNPSRSCAFPVFLASAGFALASWLLALSLPRTLPPPPEARSKAACEPLLATEAA